MLDRKGQFVFGDAMAVEKTISVATDCYGSEAFEDDTFYRTRLRRQRTDVDRVEMIEFLIKRHLTD